MKITSIFVFVVFSVLMSACPEHKASETHGSVFTVELPAGTHIKQINMDEPPALFQFLFESDFVVVGSTNKPAVPIGKRVKKAELDLADWVAGSVFQFQAEEILFSNELFKTDCSLNMNSIRKFEIFTRLGDFNEIYKENTRYLLFLKAIPDNDKIFSDLDLDKDKPYYSPYTGTRSILPDSPDPIHGTFNLGKIDLSTGRYPKLVDAIRQFCEALSSGDRVERIRNLLKLTKSDNKVLRENAEYTIGYLSSDSNAEKSER